MKNIPLLIGTIVGTLILVVGIVFVFSGSNSSQPGQKQVTVDQSIVVGEERHVKGAENAVITITEFSDFQCPACAAVAPLIESVKNKYPEQVKIVYRHLPLVSIHPHAQLAAQASEAAAAQNAFWEMHDLLFERQSEWANETASDRVRDIFIEYASEIGIDTAEFAEKIDSQEVKEAVLNDASVANELKLNSTPSLFVNDQVVSAPSQLESIVETLLTNQDS